MMRSMMKNPKISKLVFDAMEAPIGSTKRQKAKSLISIFTKADPNKILSPDSSGGPVQDGQGGMWDFLTGPTQSTGATSSPLGALPSLPDMSSLGSFGLGGSSVTVLPTAPKITPKSPTTPSSGGISSAISSTVNSFPKTSAAPAPAPTPIFPQGDPSSPYTFSPALSSTVESFKNTYINPSGPITIRSSDPATNLNMTKNQGTIAPSTPYELNPVAAPASTPGKTPNLLSQALYDTRNLVVQDVINPAIRTAVPIARETRNVGSTALGALAGVIKWLWNGTKWVAGTVYDEIGQSAANIFGGLDIDPKTGKPYDQSALTIDPKTGKPYVAVAPKPGANVAPAAAPAAPATNLSQVPGQAPGGTPAKVIVKKDNITAAGDKSTDTHTHDQSTGAVTTEKKNVAQDGSTTKTSVSSTPAAPITTPASSVATPATPTPTNLGGTTSDTTGVTTPTPTYTSGGTQTPTSQAELGSTNNMLQQALPNVPVRPGAGDDVIRTIFAGVPEDQIPLGQSKDAQIAALNNYAEQKTHMTDYLNRVNELEKKSGTFTQDATEFVRRNDTVMAGLTKMIDDAKTKYYTSAYNTPGSKERMQDYIDFLTGLKAQQNTTYSDYVNRSINQFNSELATTKSQYQNAASLYQNIVSQGTNLIVDDYNTYMTAAQAAQTRIDNAPLQRVNYLTAVAQLNNANKTNAADTFKYFGDMTNQRKQIGSEILISEKTTDENGNTVTIDNLIDPQINLPNKIFDYSQQGADPQNVADEGMTGIVNRASIAGNATDAFAEYSKWSQQFIDMAKSSDYGLSANPMVSDAAKNAAWNYGSTLIQKGKDLTANYVYNNAANAEKLITDLSTKKGGFMGIGAKAPLNRDQFISENSSTGMNKTFLGTLYDGYMAELTSGTADDPLYNPIDNFEKLVKDSAGTWSRTQLAAQTVSNWAITGQLEQLNQATAGASSRKKVTI